MVPGSIPGWDLLLVLIIMHSLLFPLVVLTHSTVHHEKWPDLADYFVDTFDWFVGGKIGEIANTLID